MLWPLSLDHLASWRVFQQIALRVSFSVRVWLNHWPGCFDNTNRTFPPLCGDRFLHKTSLCLKHLCSRTFLFTLPLSGRFCSAVHTFLKCLKVTKHLEASEKATGYVCMQPLWGKRGLDTSNPKLPEHPTTTTEPSSLVCGSVSCMSRPWCGSNLGMWFITPLTLSLWLILLLLPSTHHTITHCCCWFLGLPPAAEPFASLHWHS